MTFSFAPLWQILFRHHPVFPLPPARLLSLLAFSSNLPYIAYFVASLTSSTARLLYSSALTASRFTFCTFISSRFIAPPLTVHLVLLRVSLLPHALLIRFAPVLRPWSLPHSDAVSLQAVSDSYEMVELQVPPHHYLRLARDSTRKCHHSDQSKCDCRLFSVL